MSKFENGTYLKNAKVITKKIYTFINFHQLIYLLSSISCLDLELLAVTVFEISSFFYVKNLQRAITKKIK